MLFAAASRSADGSGAAAIGALPDLATDWSPARLDCDRRRHIRNAARSSTSTAAASISSLLLANGSTLLRRLRTRNVRRPATPTLSRATLRCDCSPVAVIVALPVWVSGTRVENSPFDAASACTAETALCRNVNAAGCATGPPDPSAWFAGPYVTEMSTPSPPWNPRPVTVTEPPTLTLPDGDGQQWALRRIAARLLGERRYSAQVTAPAGVVAPDTPGQRLRPSRATVRLHTVPAIRRRSISGLPVSPLAGTAVIFGTQRAGLY